jgi:hypothetical protein
MSLAHRHRVDEVGLKVPAVVLPSMRGRPILVVGRQARDPDDRCLDPVGPGRFALAMKVFSP